VTGVVEEEQHRLEHAAADREGLVRDREAMLPRRARIDVPDLHPLPDGDARVHQSAQVAVERPRDRRAVHVAEDLAGGDPIADVAETTEDPARRGAQDAVRSVAADDRGHPRIRLRLAAEDDAAEPMAAVRLDHRVDVRARAEARTEADDHGRVVAASTGVALGHDAVDQDRGPQLGNAGGLRVDQDRDVSGAGHGQGFVRRADQAGADAFDRRASVEHRLSERHRAPDHRRLGQLGHDHREAGPEQAIGDTAGQVPGALDDHEVLEHEVTSRHAGTEAEATSGRSA